MKYVESQKITALGVVIFSFISLLVCFSIVTLVDMAAVLLVLKTPMPENILKVGNVLGSGVGIIFSTALLTAKGKLKGIVSAGIISISIILIKIIGNYTMDLGGYLNWNGFAGMIFTIVFALIGGVVGSHWRGR